MQQQYYDTDKFRLTYLLTKVFHLRNFVSFLQASTMACTAARAARAFQAHCEEGPELHMQG